MTTEFDIDAFQREVLRGVERLERGEMEEVFRTDVSVSQVTMSTAYGSTRRFPEADDVLEQKRKVRQRILEIAKSPLGFLRRDEAQALLEEEQRLDERLRELVRDREESLVEEVVERVDHQLHQAMDEFRRALVHVEASRREQEQYRTQAIVAITNTGIRRRICAALKSVSQDAHEIAKVLTPVFVPLILTRTIPIPLEPLIISHIAVIVSRMGIAALCADHEAPTKAS
jgi:hypothetical protein